MRTLAYGRIHRGIPLWMLLCLCALRCSGVPLVLDAGDVPLAGEETPAPGGQEVARFHPLAEALALVGTGRLMEEEMSCLPMREPQPARRAVSRQTLSPLLEPEPPFDAEKEQRLRNVSRGLMLGGIALIPIDRMLMRQFARPDADPTGWVHIVNRFGDPQMLVPLIVIVYAVGDENERRSAELAALALLNAAFWTQAGKYAFGRARPGNPDEPGAFTWFTFREGYHSFPSGHSSSIFAVATVFAERHPRQRTAYYLLGAGVAAARVRLGSHFPSDTLVGAGLGIAAANAVLIGETHLFALAF